MSRPRLYALGLVIALIAAAWLGNAWRSSPVRSQVQAEATLAALPVVTLVPARTVAVVASTSTGSTAGPARTGTVAAPTPSRTPTPRPTVDYGREGATGRIVIPAIGVDQPIVPVPWRIVFIEGQAVTRWDTVDWAAGHNRGSAPIGGPGNTVLTGHTRGNGDGEFQNLWELEPGQGVQVWDTYGDGYDYVVESVEMLQEVGASLEQRQENAGHLFPTDDTRLTLITCWPEWVYTHRVIVVARPVQP